jgi:RNA-directed DNA polymerase
MSTAAATPVYGWNDIPWRTVEKNVFKLQKRIYRATKKGDRKTVHRLQRLLTKSWQARCLAVRRIAQDNHGKKTAGVDGVKSISPSERTKLVEEIRSIPSPKPVRRVWIPKPGKEEKRPLGIPTIRDRAGQAVVKLALEPEWEAKFEPNSYGFRPGRSCHDAAEAIFAVIKYTPRYVLDADIKGCFDNIDHQALLKKLDTFPLFRRVIKAWLKAGTMEGFGFQATESGTPQGGIISPLLANVALHGLEETIRGSFPRKKVVNGETDHAYRPKVVKYADDFVILHKELDVVIRCKQIAAEWLATMGLELKDSKTRITHTLNEHEGQVGFDFLGFNFRHHRVGKTHRTNCGGAAKRGSDRMLPFKTIVRPTKEAVKRHYRAVANTISTGNAWDQEELIRRLNPMIRGWSNYYSTVVSKKTYSKLDHLVCRRLLRWGYRRHGKKGRRWVAAKYFNLRRDKGSIRPWDFMVDKRTRLHRYADTRIRRHVQVDPKRSPFDGDFTYWSMRMKRYVAASLSLAKLLQKQDGKCTHCGLFFRPGDGMEIVPVASGAEGGYSNLQLLHRHCLQAKTMKDKANRRIEDNDRAGEEPYEMETLTYGSEDRRGQ